MDAGRVQGSENRPPVAPFRVMLYRYFFFDWLFRDASRGTPLERENALRINRQLSHYLLVYLRRWLGLVVCSCALGASFEKALSLDYTATVFYCLSSVSLVASTIIARLWLDLKYSATAIASERRGSDRRPRR
jgi:hypothetical protein